MTEIKKSYLMWIGAQHYPTIEAWVNEANAVGVSKRLPNVVVAEAMMAPGTVVFVAHDEGVYSPCPACVGTIECPACRKNLAEMARLADEQDDLADEHALLRDEGVETDKLLANETDDAKKAVLEDQIDALVTKIRRVRTKIRKRTEKVEELRQANEACADCGGGGELLATTGGRVEFNDGTVWDYRKYNYYLHQPQNWTPGVNGGVKEDTQCANCGGTGRLPCGKVFGCFVPSGVDYILKAEDDEEVKAEMATKGITVISTAMVGAEVKRGCGKRIPGGVYVTTTTGKAPKDVKKVVKELVASGRIQPDGVQLHGNFVEFLAPVEIDAKRFRGIKTWSLDPVAEEEAVMALDALE